MGQPSPRQLRISAAIRIAIAVLIAGGATAAAIAVAWGPLDIKTDIVGYPIFYDFNGGNYFTAYYLVIGFFPVAALLLFLGLTRLGSRLGLAAPGPRGNIRLAVSAPTTESFDPDPPLDAAPRAKRGLVAAARVAFVGALLGLEAGIGADDVWLGLGLGPAVYATAAAITAIAVRRSARDGLSLADSLAAVNAFGVGIAIAGLAWVSAETRVLILADRSVEHYPWFPVWLGLALAAAFAVTIAALLRRHGASAARAIERRALLLVAAPLLMFVLLAWLPGNAGAIDTFHSGELLAGARLVADGFYPWQDIVLTHGLLQDVVNPGVGLLLLEDSYWGFIAGMALITTPLFLIAQYFLFAYLFGRNWLFLLLTALLVFGTVLVPVNFRMILWPLTLLLLAAVLDKPTPARSASLGVLVVGGPILTPEAASTLPATVLIVVGYELYARKPGTGLVASFPRTIWFGSAAIASAAAFAGFLAGSGALDDFVYISGTLTRDHWLTGAHPPSHFDSSEALLRFEALSPIVAILIAFAYAVARLRRRVPFTTADWVIGAVAIAAVPYYLKFLARMDAGHAAQVYSLALPLILYIAYRITEILEGWLRGTGIGRRITSLVAHPASLVLVVVTVVFGWSALDNRVNDAAARFRPEVLEKPWLERVGYAEFDPVLYRDLKRVIDGYLSPGDRLFDFTNSPALFFYLIERYPSTRYFHVSLALRSETQEDLIDRLREAHPKLIVYDSTVPGGLPTWDLIPTSVRMYDVSSWILDHYRPLLTSHGHTFYARRDQPPPGKFVTQLVESPTLKDPEFQTQRCNWGFAPNFLDADQPGASPNAASAQLRRPSRQPVNVVGWAGDVNAEAPARVVLAAQGGQVVARARPHLLRPDLAVSTPGLRRAGYQLSVPVDRLRAAPGRGRLQVYAIAADGSVAELGKAGSPIHAGTARLGGRSVRLRPEAVTGSVDRIRRAPALEIVAPEGSRFSDFRWLELEAKGGFREGRFFIYDDSQILDGRREITFKTLNRSPRRFLVPVDSCPQWHGYPGRRLHVSFSRHQDIAGVRLIR